MQVKNCIETDYFTLKERAQSLTRHKLNLQNVKKTIDNDLPYSYRNQLPKFKSPLKDTNDTSFKNVIMYERLIDIAQMKSPYRVENPNQTPRSLNYKSRLTEANRITTENSFIAKRLIGVESSLSFRQMKREYNGLEKYKSRISKISRLAQIQKIVNQSQEKLGNVSSKI